MSEVPANGAVPGHSAIHARSTGWLAYLNFVVTNFLPRKSLTRLVGWYSRIDSPRLTAFSIRVWQFFADDLRLEEARQSDFRSLRDCFTRELRPDARPINARPDIVISPCDAVIGALGSIEGDEILQVKDSPYSLSELLGGGDTERYLGGSYITLRLKSSMYHRFHAPVDCDLGSLQFIPGEYWNVNPPTLARVPRLFCRNERAVMTLKPAIGEITLIPVAAILVGSLRLHCLDAPLDMTWQGPGHLECKGASRKGDELGYFQHGSTIILLASSHYLPLSTLREGSVIRVGQALLRQESGPGGQFIQH